MAEDFIYKTDTELQKSNNWVIWLLASSVFTISIITAIHAQKLFLLGDNMLMSYVLAICYEMLIIVTLLTIALKRNMGEKTARNLWMAVYILFIFQIVSNIFYYFNNLDSGLLLQASRLIGIEANTIAQRIFSSFLGTVLPSTTFFFTKTISHIIKEERTK